MAGEAARGPIEIESIKRFKAAYQVSQAISSPKALALEEFNADACDKFKVKGVPSPSVASISLRQAGLRTNTRLDFEPATPCISGSPPIKSIGWFPSTAG